MLLINYFLIHSVDVDPVVASGVYNLAAVRTVFFSWLKFKLWKLQFMLFPQFFGL